LRGDKTIAAVSRDVHEKIGIILPAASLTLYCPKTRMTPN